MTDNFLRWVESWWDSPGRPAGLAAGQVWTVFHPDPGQEAPGTIVALIETQEEMSRVVPLHCEPGARTACEPELGGSDLSFGGRMVAAVELAGFISNAAFADARYLGQASGEAVARLSRAADEAGRILAGLEDLRRCEAGAGAGPVSDEELARAFETGILKLVPMYASFIEWADLHRGLHFNLAPWAEPAERGYAGRPEPVPNRLAAEPGNIYHPETIYHAMRDQLETEPGHDRSLYNEQTHKISGEELRLLRALVHARLRRWDEAETCFRSLLDSPRSDLGQRGLVWLSQNYNTGDPQSAREMAGRLAGPGTETDREDILRQARETPLHEFMRIESLDREIMRLWRKVEEGPLL